MPADRGQPALTGACAPPGGHRGGPASHLLWVVGADGQAELRVVAGAAGRAGPGPSWRARAGAAQQRQHHQGGRHSKFHVAGSGARRLYRILLRSRATVGRAIVRLCQELSAAQAGLAIAMGNIGRPMNMREYIGCICWELSITPEPSGEGVGANSTFVFVMLFNLILL